MFIKLIVVLLLNTSNLHYFFKKSINLKFNFIHTINE